MGHITGLTVYAFLTSFELCFEVNKQIGLRSREIWAFLYSMTNLADKEHLPMTLRKNNNNNNNNMDNVTATPSDNSHNWLIKVKAVKHFYKQDTSWIQIVYDIWGW